MWVVVHLTWRDEGGPLLCGLPFQTPAPQSNHEKNTGQIPIGRYSTKHLTSTPQNYQGHQKQGKANKLSRPRGI